jgi:hypothetical protein
VPLLRYADITRENLYSRLAGANQFRILAGAPLDVQATAFATTVLRNHKVRTVLERLAALDLPPWYLTAGALFQTVWNAAHGIEDLTAGIRDLDMFFYDGDDLSYEAEDAAIKRCVAACQDLDVELEPRNIGNHRYRKLPNASSLRLRGVGCGRRDPRLSSAWQRCCGRPRAAARSRCGRPIRSGAGSAGAGSVQP